MRQFTLTLGPIWAALLVGCGYKTICNAEDPACSAWALLLAYGRPAYSSVAIGKNAHTVMLFTDGTMRAWGGGSNGRLGNNGSTNTGDGAGASIIATGTINVGAAVQQITGGHQSTCALLATGAVRCWGFGGDGRLGYNATTNVADGATPTIVQAGDVPIGGAVTQISAASHFTCALLTTGAVRCWGGSPAGETGYNSTVSSADGLGPSIIARGDVPLGGIAVQIATGGDAACAVLNTGAVRCWGNGSGGRLGRNATSNIGDGVGPSIIAAGDIALGGTAVQVTVGLDHACALLTTGAVRCWGSGAGGALGYNSTSNIGDGVGPSIVTAGDVPIGGIAVYVSAGSSATCALLINGQLRCWGSGTGGTLGYNSTSNIGDGTGPAIVDAGNVPVGVRVANVATAAGSTCAVLDAYIPRLRCWGSGGNGALGYNSTANVGDGSGLSIISAGDVPTGR